MGDLPEPASVADEKRLAERVASTLRADARIARARDIRLVVTDGVVLLEGEVPDIASKRRAHARVLACEGVRSAVDRVRVPPTERMGDGAIRDHVVAAIGGDTTFAECSLKFVRDGELVLAREALDPRHGSISVRVVDGEVILDGTTPSLVHKRLAGVLAWWVPGTRNVVDALVVSPEEVDGDDEMTEAVRVVLEKDPLIDAAQIVVSTDHGRVTLRGTLASDAQRTLAERDAWFVEGVLDVNSRPPF
jgi:osmotically-inducible protein OsmY